MKPPKKALDRCTWATNDLSIQYHDREWGVPQHDDRVLFEFLILEGAQAGLSWDTILRKRANYRAAFDGFDPKKIARYDRRKTQQLLRDEGIVRNRLKITSAIQNAKAFLAVQKEFVSFDRYLWQFVGGKPRVNAWRQGKKVPARTPESDAMSQDLKKRGFNFGSSTICYAFMQATGMVNDHAIECFRYLPLNKDVLDGCAGYMTGTDRLWDPVNSEASSQARSHRPVTCSTATPSGPARPYNGKRRQS